jgi:4-alpha-glucanotransferase
VAAADSSVDEYGIQRRYLNNADEPAELDAETVAALRAAIGEPDPDAVEHPPLVIRGSGWTAPAAAEVELETGERRSLRPDRRIDLPYGYHWLDIGGRRHRLIVSPGRCVRPSRRSWGWTAQLYATRSAHSWGIGDFADLGRLTTLAAEQGAGFVLINPLHAGGSTSAELPQQPSPYFPASRRFFNPLYLSVPELPGAVAVLGSRLTELERTAQAAGEPRIDRDRIWRVKRPALREIFDATGAAADPELAEWRRQRGQPATDFATWCLLTERYGGSWPDWPAEARSPAGSLARRLPDEQPDDVAFVCWLQWQSERQLSAASGRTAVLQDLPIGVDPRGADAWSYQDLLAPEVSIGAPPDPFNSAGQDWGLPPFVPWRLRAADYQPFIEAIRATIAHAGGLRIDHVMGFFRLWWVPTGRSADRGGYVRYPADDLLGIVALESHRAQAPVVGEDLGTVEPGVREQLAECNVLSYRLLWFEAEPPARWPAAALAAVSTHDLPTVTGLWTGQDLADQQRSGLTADPAATERLRRLLTERAGVAAEAGVADAVAGAYRLLAQAPSLLLAASLEDALAVPDRPNMPGTVARPNWSIPLPVPLEEVPGQPLVRTLAGQLRTAVERAAVVERATVVERDDAERGDAERDDAERDDAERGEVFAAATDPRPDGQPALVIVRHGETAWSRSGKHTGRTDVPLTEAGERQARQAGRLLAELLPDAGRIIVLSSPRSRAVRTAELAGHPPDELTEDAAEWDYGELEGRTTPEIREQYPDWSIWSGPVPGGETAAAVSARADRLLARRQPDQTLLVFSHGHFSRCLAARWLEQPVEFGRLLRLDTATVSALGFEHGGPVVLRWNLDPGLFTG